jgi:beta-glucosidase
VLGRIEPTGRLPITFARHAGQLPVFYNQLRGQHGDRYADLTQDPLFAFGEGLSYSRVEYRDLRLDDSEVAAADTIRATVTLTNIGERPSTETVQVYVTDTVTSVTWAERELKAFRQVTVPAGATVDVSIEIPASACSLVDAVGDRVVEPGDFELLVGTSSRPADLQSAPFRITSAD